MSSLLTTTSEHNHPPPPLLLTSIPPNSPLCFPFRFPPCSYDVSKYYGHAYGFPYASTLGASYINELVSRLTSNTTLVQAGSSNTSTDLGVVEDGMRFYADFSHDNNMVQILAAMELLEVSHPPPFVRTSRVKS
jgi:hypothetical protein